MQANSAGRVMPSSNRLGPFLSKLSGTLAPLLFLLLLSIVLSFLTPNFASHDNLKQIVIQATVVAILACGQTAVIISGNIDLSVGAVMAFAGVTAAQAMNLGGQQPIGVLPVWTLAILALPAAILIVWLAVRPLRSLHPVLIALLGLLFFVIAETIATLAIGTLMSRHGVNMWGGVLIACACGLSAGLLTGLLTAYGRIPSFIVTLGMMGVAVGLGGIVSHSQTVSGLAPGFEAFGSNEMGSGSSWTQLPVLRQIWWLFTVGGKPGDGIPYPVLILLLVAVVVYMLLAQTRWGRSLYAIGGNQEAARLSGIPLTLMTTTVFALSGLLAGIAAVVNVSRTSVAQYNSGEGLELYAVAATVIGGTSLFGGQGGIPGTIIGALLMFTIKNGCNLLGVGSEIERAVIGAVVILAVLYDRYILPLVRRGVEAVTKTGRA